MVGRFSPRRGKFGIIICRKIEDKELFGRRCRDAANDGQGFIVMLDDDDLTELVGQVKNVTRQSGDYPILRTMFDALVM